MIKFLNFFESIAVEKVEVEKYFVFAQPFDRALKPTENWLDFKVGGFWNATQKVKSFYKYVQFNALELSIPLRE